VTAVGSLMLKSVGEMVDFELGACKYKQHIIIYASVFLFVMYVVLLCLIVGFESWVGFVIIVILVCIRLFVLLILKYLVMFTLSCSNLC